jgi:Protein of unknown function (DUF2769)
MSTGENEKVPYTVANIKKCMCSECPVQADSKCVKEKLENLKRELEGAREVDVPEPKSVPGIYCSTGKATCQDLDPRRGCICNTCDVWKEYHLQNVKPVMYFCQKGKAA